MTDLTDLMDHVVVTVGMLSAVYAGWRSRRVGKAVGDVHDEVRPRQRKRAGEILDDITDRLDHLDECIDKVGSKVERTDRKVEQIGSRTTTELAMHGERLRELTSKMDHHLDSHAAERLITEAARQGRLDRRS